MARKRGRPRKGNSPEVPWKEVDRLMVFGEEYTDERSGVKSVRYPAHSEIAERFGVSRSLVNRYSAQHKCMERRRNASAREQASFERKVVEKRAESRAMSTEEELQILDACLLQIRDKVESGEIRLADVQDINTLMRLKEFKLGNADSRQEVTPVSFETIQARHRRLRDEMDGLPPEVTGAVVADSAAAPDVGVEGDDDGQTVH